MTHARPLRLVVLGTVASNPYAGMAWMHMQITVGLLRLGHDVVYVESTSTWPYDPTRQEKVQDSTYACAYLERVATSFGIADRWAYRRSYSDGAWLGPAADRAEEMLAHSDAVLNVSGASRPDEDGISVGTLVYFGTDPVYPEITYHSGDEAFRYGIDQHSSVITYGENIGTAASPIPPLPKLVGRTRQPVLMDLWETSTPPRRAYTTVTNWRQDGREVVFDGEPYSWSKDLEFARFVDLPTLVEPPIELATNLAPPESIQFAPGDHEQVKARGLGGAERAELERHRWNLVDARPLTEDPWRYRDYVMSSRGEISVARDLNVRLRSGWFSERSACYLAAGRPVVAQNTGFGEVIPTGEGLFAFDTTEEAVAAIAEIESDYRRHSAAARAIAEDYFRAETVLDRVLADIGLR